MIEGWRGASLLKAVKTSKSIYTRRNIACTKTQVPCVQVVIGGEMDERAMVNTLGDRLASPMIAAIWLPLRHRPACAPRWCNFSGVDAQELPSARP